MPYITKEERVAIRDPLTMLLFHLKDAPEDKIDGYLNYIITNLLIAKYSPKYFNYNRAIGVLECVKQEFYRRKVAPYEDKKLQENGDVYLD
jgi:hypothetical protein